MVGLLDVVLEDLVKTGADSETIDLWKSIIQWNEKGGPDFVESKIIEKINTIKEISR